ncbi:uncharacterized protein LOC119746203 [Patiria miniata]|uniref:Acyl-coenzyme A thioesterase THEM4 n=1 Tax=Patiria miniata TaxID=46514 RepID=A0A914BRY8_PATMI|nr:uncharacterized protein LOC119746203 [Patiria miniata]
MASHIGLIRCLLRATSTRATHRLKSYDYVSVMSVESHLETRASSGRCFHEADQNHPRSTSSYSHGRFSQNRDFQTTSKVAASARKEWLPETDELYSRLRAQADRDGWVQVRNTTTDPRPSRYFSRVATENGPVMQYAMFLQKDERKLMGVCQFGEEAQGPQGFTQGGASATIHDVITGLLSQEVYAKFTVTASLTVNFKRPTPLRSAVLMEANVDKIEGRKVFLKSCLKSPDGATLYSDCTALYIIIEDKPHAVDIKYSSPG